MTVLRKQREPEGTYTQGYDAGLSDAVEHQPRRLRRPHYASASVYRYGYADGYDDGCQRPAGDRSIEPEPRDDFGRPLGMHDYRTLSPEDKRRHDEWSSHVQSLIDAKEYGP